MAKFQHLYSTTAGNVPSSLQRGQLAINIPDKIIYAADPTGVVAPISNGNPGVTSVSSMLAAHIPVQYHPVGQFGVGSTEAQLQAEFVIGASIATLSPIAIFMLGRKWYTPILTCALSPVGAYSISMDTVARTASIQPLSAVQATSGVVNNINGRYSIVFYSDGHIYPWFFLPGYVGIANASTPNPGDTPVYRVSPYQTFGAMAVSTGFAGAAATSYWGTH